MKLWDISWTTKDKKTHRDIFEFDKLSDALRGLTGDITGVTAHETKEKNMTVEHGDTVSIDRGQEVVTGTVAEILSVEKTGDEVFIELTLLKGGNDQDTMYIMANLSKIEPA